MFCSKYSMIGGVWLRDHGVLEHVGALSETKEGAALDGRLDGGVKAKEMLDGLGGVRKSSPSAESR